MRRLFIGILAVCAAFSYLSCTGEASGEPDFWLGADISWATEYESRGYKFYNADGEEREYNELMKELELNAVRPRGWVDP